MQEQHPATDQRPVSQPAMSWSPDERKRLEEIAPIKARKAMLLSQFPGRSLSSIRVKLAHERRRLGISQQSDNLQKRNLETTILDPRDPGLPCDYPRRQRIACEKANSAFLAAIQAAA